MEHVSRGENAGCTVVLDRSALSEVRRDELNSWLKRNAPSIYGARDFMCLEYGGLYSVVDKP